MKTWIGIIGGIINAEGEKAIYSLVLQADASPNKEAVIEAFKSGDFEVTVLEGPETLVKFAEFHEITDLGTFDGDFDPKTYGGLKVNAAAVDTAAVTEPEDANEETVGEEPPASDPVQESTNAPIPATEPPASEETQEGAQP